MKKVKVVKTTIPKVKVKTETIEYYEIKCPHCGTFLHGGYNRSHIVYKCSRCENSIKIDWDNAILVSHF